MFVFPGKYLEILHFCDCSEMHTKAKRVEAYKKDTNRAVTFISPKDGGSLLPQAPDGQHEPLAVITQKPGFLFMFPKNACFHLKLHKSTMLFLIYFTPDKNYIMPRVIGLGVSFQQRWDGLYFPGGGSLSGISPSEDGTGAEGTPTPSAADVINEKDRWRRLLHRSACEFSYVHYLMPKTTWKEWHPLKGLPKQSQ